MRWLFPGREIWIEALCLDCAAFMSGPFVRNRLDPSYLDSMDTYVAEFGQEAAKLLGWS